MITDLGDYGFTDSSTTTKVRALQKSIRRIERIRPWPFLETKIDLSFDGTSGLATNFPANFRAALMLKNTATGQRLEPMTQGDVEDIVGVQLAQVGAPQVYYPEAEKLNLWPVPPNGTTVRMRYIRWSDAISSSTTSSQILIPERHHDVIVSGALIVLYDMEDDPELAARQQEHYLRALDEMIEDLFVKQFDRPEHIRVTDPDSWDY